MYDVTQPWQHTVLSLPHSNSETQSPFHMLAAFVSSKAVQLLQGAVSVIV